MHCFRTQSCSDSPRGRSPEHLEGRERRGFAGSNWCGYRPLPGGSPFTIRRGEPVDEHDELPEGVAYVEVTFNSVVHRVPVTPD
jgi:hypothetical protein